MFKTKNVICFEQILILPTDTNFKVIHLFYQYCCIIIDVNLLMELE